MTMSRWLLAAALTLAGNFALASGAEERAQWRVDRKQAQESLRKELSDLREKIEDVAHSGKVGAEDVGAKLSRRADRLEERIEEMGERGSDRWERARKRIRREYDDLSESVKDWERRRNEKR
ncbi:MAG: hypothetical protein HY925_06980 [Elusimicrobia bacterium]|nr:hypothetical protein [Elusimicrobiota bacterium]